VLKRAPCEWALRIGHEESVTLEMGIEEVIPKRPGTSLFRTPRLFPIAGISCQSIQSFKRVCRSQTRHIKHTACHTTPAIDDEQELGSCSFRPQFLIGRGNLGSVGSISSPSCLQDQQLSYGSVMNWLPSWWSLHNSHQYMPMTAWEMREIPSSHPASDNASGISTDQLAALQLLHITARVYSSH
jgi:hypothetical protein